MKFRLRCGIIVLLRGVGDLKRLLSGEILRRGLPFIAVALIYIALSIENMNPYELLTSRLCIQTELEHVLMGLTLLVGGELLYDISLRERR